LCNKWQILGTLPVLIAGMAGDRVHHLLEHLWLQALFLEKTFIKRDPFLQA
jgi:hypothetical protein